MYLEKKTSWAVLNPASLADFVVINPIRLGAVLENPYANLVLVTSERDVDEVFVGGELRVDHGKVLQQDMDAVQQEVDRRVTEK